MGREGYGWWRVDGECREFDASCEGVYVRAERGEDGGWGIVLVST